jgi:hypothetical protein
MKTLFCQAADLKQRGDGDSNGNLNFESEVANCIRSHLPTKNDIINTKMNKYINLIDDHIKEPNSKYITITLHESDNIYEYRKEILERLIKFYGDIEITSKEFKEDMFYFDIKIKLNKS